MGDGIVDLERIRAAIENAGYTGPQEVEIFSASNWWLIRMLQSSLSR